MEVIVGLSTVVIITMILLVHFFGYKAPHHVSLENSLFPKRKKKKHVEG